MAGDHVVFPQKKGKFRGLHYIRLDLIIDAMNDNKQAVLKIIYLGWMYILANAIFHCQGMETEYIR